ncbi:MAG: vitamin K epoxide reductase family protein [Gammaproteobacteria bacterium]|jgi:uncharacterized membrane protein
MSKKTSRSKKHPQVEAAARAVPRELLVGALATLGAALTVVLIVVAARQAELPFCGDGSDCDIVQGSRWSMLLGLPIAVWGFLVYGFIAFAALLGLKRQSRWRAIVFLATVGFAVSIYLNIIAVTVIEATCAYCLVSFALITLLYALSWRAGGTGGLNGWRLGSTAAAIIVVGLMHLHYAGAFDPAAGPEDPYLRGLAEHLEANGAKFYGAFWCPHCQEQKLVFGASAKRLPYVECSPNGQRGARSTACIGADISNYPTWIIGGQRFERAMTSKLLARYSGYAAAPPPASE